MKLSTLHHKSLIYIVCNLLVLMIAFERKSAQLSARAEQNFEILSKVCQRSDWF